MKRKSTILILIALTFNSTIFAQTDRKLEREKPSAQTEKRIALVIGNGAYQKAKPLPNPANDAADMAQALKDLGFEVLSGVNQNKRQMEILIREFGTKLANGGTGLFYYAGHGIQVGGENYIVPIDADIPDEDEVAYLAVPISLVLTKMTTAKNDLNIVILDACRNNPFARSWRSFRDSSNNDGLAKISPPTGTLVLYATEPGKVASDGAGRNGLFTEALLKQIKKPNLEYDQMVKALSTDVWQKSNKQQLPWKEGNSLQDFYFVKADAKTSTTKTQPANETEPTPLPMPKPTPLPTPTPVSVAQTIDAEEIYWQEISNRDTRSGYELYLAEYQNGKYAVQANNKIKQFKQDELQKQKDIERSKWREAQNQNTRESYNSYLTAFPNGEFAADARLGVKALDSKVEQAKWLEANSINSKEAYKSYLALYPKGEFAASAGSKIREIENKEEQTKWEEVQFLNRKSAYQSYLSAYPNGKNAASAKQKIKEFEDEDARKLKELEKAKERAKWEEAERLKTVAEYKGYLSIYPTGEFASLARLRLRDLGEVVTPSEVKPISPPQVVAASNSNSPVAVWDSAATIAGNIDTLGAAFDRGESVAFKINYYGSGNFLTGSRKMLLVGLVTMSKFAVDFEPMVGDQGFSVSPDKILDVINEKPIRVRLKVAIKNKKGDKEDKKDFEFYHTSTVLAGFRFSCTRCDVSMSVLFAFLQHARGKDINEILKSIQ